MLENVLTHHDPVLQKHLLRYGITSQVFPEPSAYFKYGPLRKVRRC